MNHLQHVTLLEGNNKFGRETTTSFHLIRFIPSIAPRVFFAHTTNIRNARIHVVGD
jgi:hypothetical protein